MNGKLRWMLWWIAPALALAALLGIETDWGGGMHLLPAAPAAIEPKPVASALLPEYRVEGGVASLSETVDRTLFNPTRRPAPPSTASGEAGRNLQGGQFILTGTTLAGDRAIAFLKEVSGGKARTVRKGDKINGMLVADVQPDRVRFTQGGDTEELLLKVAAGPKTTVVAAARPAGPAAGAPTRGGSQAAQAARRAAAARGAAAGEAPQAVPGQPPTGRAARAAARAAAQAGAGAGAEAAGNPAPAAGASADPWAAVYQRMQRGGRSNTK
jgi:hypothetical protein